MTRRLRRSASSSCLSPKEPGSDGVPDPNHAPFSTRVRKLLEGVSPLEVPTAPCEPEKTPVRKQSAVHGIRAVRRLARLKALPPLSPEGRQFAIGVRERRYTCADVVGEGLFQFLEDGLPGYEVFFGETRATKLREHIEKLQSGDSKEIRTLLSLGVGFEPAETWSTYEKNRASRYPVPIETSGVAGIRPIVQHGGAGGGSGCKSSGKVSKMTKCSPKSPWTKEQMGFSTDSGSDSPAWTLATLELSDYEDDMESTSEGEIRPNDKPAPAEQLDSKEWPESPDEWSTESLESPGCDSEENPEDKLLYELFPHARFRTDIGS